MTAFIPPYKQPLVEDNIFAVIPRLPITQSCARRLIATRNGNGGEQYAADRWRSGGVLMTESRAKELGLVPLGYLRATHLLRLMSGRTCCSVRPGHTAGAGTCRFDNERSDIDRYDEAFAAQTLANIQLLGSERFLVKYWGVHMPLAKWTIANLTAWRFDCLRASLRGDRRADDSQTLHELRRRGGGFGLVTACLPVGLARQWFWRRNNGNGIRFTLNVRLDNIAIITIDVPGGK